MRCIREVTTFTVNVLLAETVDAIKMVRNTQLVLTLIPYFCITENILTIWKALNLTALF